MTIMTKSDAMAAIETANWDAYDSALSGAEIWGVHGQFAAPRAASHYTYQQALQEVERYDWDGEMNHTHTEYSHVDGQIVCACGAVRLAPGKWADEKTSARLRNAAKRKTARLIAEHGTAVDAYGQRLK